MEIQLADLEPLEKPGARRRPVRRSLALRCRIAPFIARRIRRIPPGDPRPRSAGYPEAARNWFLNLRYRF